MKIKSKMMILTYVRWPKSVSDFRASILEKMQEWVKFNNKRIWNILM